ncbi:nitrous oxide-stimulated promoter family protein [Enterococcus sp. UD-01]|uniref:nitrous oxide-stimulated promoter family protein n=1 Tax=Enterococcus sp. UD-01 TaxID=3373911 RepID=UPI003833950C
MRERNCGPVIMEEIKMIEVMIRLYYQKVNQADISEDRMLQYAQKRLEFCRFGEEKTTCQRCPIHCYQPKYRAQMKKIMRYSGPRMLFKHPYLTIRHAYRGWTRRVTK